MYYDIVCSVYETNKAGEDPRIDSYLMSGGYKTEEDAQKDAQNFEASLEANNPSLYAIIEIEEHLDNGSLNCIISVKEQDGKNAE